MRVVRDHDMWSFAIEILGTPFLHNISNKNEMVNIKHRTFMEVTKIISAFDQ